MDDIVWTINPQNDTMEQLLYRMKEFAAEILEPLNINFSFDEQGVLSTLTLDIRKRKDLYLVFKEAINNAANAAIRRALKPDTLSNPMPSLPLVSIRMSSTPRRRMAFGRARG